MSFPSRKPSASCYIYYIYSNVLGTTVSPYKIRRPALGYIYETIILYGESSYIVAHWDQVPAGNDRLSTIRRHIYRNNNNNIAVRNPDDCIDRLTRRRTISAKSRVFTRCVGGGECGSCSFYFI